MEMNRLRWASRRGMLELDLILQPFVENVYPGLPAEHQQLFDRLLDGEDQDLFGWFMRHNDPDDADLLKIVTIIRDSSGLPNRD